MGRPENTAARFEPTHWSMILAAIGQPSAEAAHALEALCRIYWYPLYAFARRRGLAPADAQDLVQNFFADFLQRDWGAGLDRQKGRFRTFLLSALEHFLANEWHKSRALKRGGGAALLCLDMVTGEEIYSRETVAGADSTLAYDRAFAATLVRHVFEQLCSECRQAGKAALFEELHGQMLDGRDPADAPAVAARLGMNEDAVRQARHRLRQRFRKLLEAAVAQTVADPTQVQAEARHLISVCASDARGIV